MKRVCAWCGKEIGSVPSDRHRDDEISHGICPSCVSNFTFQKGASLDEYIESIDLPVVLVDDDVQVRAANAAACTALGKDLDALRDRRGGEVFECAHARLPGGCGRTIHCSGCAIRRAVKNTFATGEPQNGVPATLTRDHPDDASAVALTITTVKVGNIVMLRVERMG
jgi:hypothetical protein